MKRRNIATLISAALAVAIWSQPSAAAVPKDRQGGVKDGPGFGVEVATGNIPSMSIVQKFGRNDAVGSSFEMISLLSGARSDLAAATTVRVKAGGDAADAAAGNGCREVTVIGIDSNLAEVSEAITMNANGTLASDPTTATFWRPYRAYCSSAGANAQNTAAIVIENGSGGTDLLTIAAAEGQTQFAGYTVPTGYTAYILRITLTVDSAKNADIKLVQRQDFDDVTAPRQSKRVVEYFDGVAGEMTVAPIVPWGPFPAETDLWFEGKSASGAEASAGFEILLVAQ